MIVKMKANFPFILSFLSPVSIEENDLCVVKYLSAFGEKGPEFLLRDFVCFP